MTALHKNFEYAIFLAMVLCFTGYQKALGHIGGKNTALFAKKGQWVTVTLSLPNDWISLPDEHFGDFQAIKSNLQGNIDQYIKIESNVKLSKKEVQVKLSKGGANGFHADLFLKNHYLEQPKDVKISLPFLNAKDRKMAYFLRDADEEKQSYGELSFAQNSLSLGQNSPKKSLWVLGFMHVLEGFDHLLFLLALILVTQSFRSTLIPLSAFTIGHSAIFVLLSAGFTMNIDAWVIEALIAASIGMMVIVERKYKLNSKYLVGLTLFLGFVHGLGFYNALSPSVSRELQPWEILQVTLSIEVAQVFIAFVFLFFIKLVSRYRYRSITHKVAQFCVLLISAYWTIERCAFGIIL